MLEGILAQYFILAKKNSILVIAIETVTSQLHIATLIL